MPNIRMACFLWVLLILSACTNWPPSEKKAREHFEAQRESFDRLAEKMRGTDYWRVSMDGQSGVIVTPNAGGDYGDQFSIDDDTEWRELLVATGMYMVLQQDGAVWTDPAQMWGEHENRTGHNGFSHNLELWDEFKICKPNYKEIRCGRCAVALQDDWFIYYVWYPEYFSKEKWDSYLNGETSLDDYSESRDEAFRQCHIDGYTEMGYDVDKIFNLEEN